MTPSGTIDDVLAEVERSTTLEGGVETTFAQLQKKIVDATQNADPATKAKIQQVFTTFRANNDKLAAAIVANTDAAPDPTVP